MSIAISPARAYKAAPAAPRRVYLLNLSTAILTGVTAAAVFASSGTAQILWGIGVLVGVFLLADVGHMVLKGRKGAVSFLVLWSVAALVFGGIAAVQWNTPLGAATTLSALALVILVHSKGMREFISEKGTKLSSQIEKPIKPAATDGD